MSDTKVTNETNDNMYIEDVKLSDKVLCVLHVYDQQMVDDMRNWKSITRTSVTACFRYSGYSWDSERVLIERIATRGGACR